MGKGVLRSLYVSNGIKLDFIPVDVPINLMIVSAWNTAVGRYKWVAFASRFLVVFEVLFYLL